MGFGRFHWALVAPKSGRFHLFLKCRFFASLFPGAGKSSLFSALLRLTPFQSGTITVDGRDIRSVRLTTLRRSFGVVPQTPLLFSGSIRENMDPYGLYPEEEIAAALQATRVWEVLCRIAFEKGLLTRGSYLQARRANSPVVGRWDAYRSDDNLGRRSRQQQQQQGRWRQQQQQQQRRQQQTSSAGGDGGWQQQRGQQQQTASTGAGGWQQQQRQGSGHLYRRSYGGGRWSESVDDGGGDGSERVGGLLSALASLDLLQEAPLLGEREKEQQEQRKGPVHTVLDMQVGGGGGRRGCNIWPCPCS